MKYKFVYHYWEVMGEKRIRRHEESPVIYNKLYDAEAAVNVMKMFGDYQFKLGDRFTVRKVGA